MRVGSMFREVRRAVGRTFTWDMRFAAREPDRAIAIESVLRATLPRQLRTGRRTERHAGHRTQRCRTVNVVVAAASWIERAERKAVLRRTGHTK